MTNDRNNTQPTATRSIVVPVPREWRRDPTVPEWAVYRVDSRGVLVLADRMVGPDPAPGRSAGR